METLPLESSIQSQPELSGYFDEDKSALDKALSEIDELYNYSKKILDDYLVPDEQSKPNRLGSSPKKPKSMMFVAQQISNLTSIKNMKLNYLKQKTAIKKDEYKENQDKDSGINAEAVLKYLMDNNISATKFTLGCKDINSNVYEGEIIQDIDSMLLSTKTEDDEEEISTNNTIHDEIISEFKDERTFEYKLELSSETLYKEYSDGEIEVLDINNGEFDLLEDDSIIHIESKMKVIIE